MVVCALLTGYSKHVLLMKYYLRLSSVSYEIISISDTLVEAPYDFSYCSYEVVSIVLLNLSIKVPCLPYRLSRLVLICRSHYS